MNSWFFEVDPTGSFGLLGWTYVPGCTVQYYAVPVNGARTLIHQIPECQGFPNSATWRHRGDYGLIFARQETGASPGTRILRFESATGVTSIDGFLTGTTVPRGGAAFRGNDQTFLLRQAGPCLVTERRSGAPFAVVATPGYPCNSPLNKTNALVAAKPR